MVQAECGLKADSQLRETLGSSATVAVSQSEPQLQRGGRGVTDTARRTDGRTEQTDNEGGTAAVD